MKEINLEKWTSTDNQEEVHFFIKGTDIYLFGYNPKKVSFDSIAELMKKNGFVLSEKRERNENK